MRRAIAVVCFVVFTAMGLDAGNNAWTSSGPYGGLVHSFTFHPVKLGLVFVSTEPGLVFRSRDGGKTWQYLNVHGVVAVHPKKPDRLILVDASTYHSFDEGATWTRVSHDSIAEPGFETAWDPLDPETLYVLSAGTVHKTMDAGRTWTAYRKGLPRKQGFRLVADPARGDVLYASVGDRIYKTTDGARSWLPADDGLPRTRHSALAIHPQQPDVLYAAGNDVHRTSDGGGHWERICQGMGGGTAWALAVNPRQPNMLYAAGVGTDGTAWRSVDGGARWTPMDVDPDELQAVAVHPRLPHLVFIGGIGQGVFRSQNAGADWQPANTGLNARITNHLSANKKRILARDAAYYMFQSVDRGKSWRRLDFGVRGPLARDVQAHPVDLDVIATAGTFGRETAFAISRDGGRSWRFPGSFLGADFVRFDPRDSRTIYLAIDGTAGSSSGVAKSADQGQSWKLMNVGLTDRMITAFVVNPQNGRDLWLGTESGKIFRSTDGAAAWKNRSNGLPQVDVSSIAVDPAAPDTAYATADNKLYKTVNGGKSWVRKDDGSCAALVVSVDPLKPGTVFLGYTDRLLVSRDAGETWAEFDDSGLDSVNRIYMLLRHPAKANTYLVGTDRGVYSYTGKAAAAARIP